MTTALATNNIDFAQLDQVLIKGNLASLNPQQRIEYYKAVCDRCGLDPVMKPFEYIDMKGKVVLYALKACTEQLRFKHGLSVNIVAREQVGDCYVVTARASMPNGRCDESTGVVAVSHLKGEDLANAYMKAETKAKRRVTLSVCGLGMLDESEVDTIPGAIKQPIDINPVAMIPQPEHVSSPSTAAYKISVFKRLQAINADFDILYARFGQKAPEEYTDEEMKEIIAYGQTLSSQKTRTQQEELAESIE